LKQELIYRVLPSHKHLCSPGTEVSLQTPRPVQFCFKQGWRSISQLPPPNPLGHLQTILPKSMSWTHVPPLTQAPSTHRFSSSHVSPTNSSLHIHLNESSSKKQVPPFLHGSPLHGSTIKYEIDMLLFIVKISNQNLFFLINTFSYFSHHF
jgi:hypothetical protein